MRSSVAETKREEKHKLLFIELNTCSVPDATAGTGNTGQETKS